MTRFIINVVLLAIISFINTSDGLAVMSIDFGSEFMKIAIVKAGIPMEIALNKESRRKTPVIVALKDGERFFSDPASSTAIRFPNKAYMFLHDLLGKKITNPLVKRFRNRFPFYKLKEDQQLGTVIFEHSDKEDYSVEELVAMILEQAKKTAEDHADHPIKDCVITVPPFFNQAERRALLRAGKLANLKVLQLINDNTAVALNYGVFRRADFNETAVHYMFFDMGSSATTATIVSYVVVNQKNPITGYMETFPQMTISGFGFDRELGGIEMSLRLRDHLANAFNAQKKTKNDVRKNNRSMAKLLKEAHRLKHVLSANAAHYAQIEGLLDDKDFKHKVTREEFEDMCSDLYPAVKSVIAEALNGTIIIEDIKEIILMGGATRMLKIQDIIKEATGRTELGKGINTDEAAAMGAVYQAAHLSTGFRVKKFGVKEANHYPIQVAFDRIRVDTDTNEVDTKNVKRIIFTHMNPYPQKKVMTFNKNHEDFSFSVGYNKLSSSDEKIFDATTISETTLTGITDAYNANNVKDSIESKGIKAHFRLDDSGIVNIESVEMIFERLNDEPEEESALSMLGSKLSSLFGSSTETANDTKTEKTAEEAKLNNTETTDNSTESKGNSTKENDTSVSQIKLKPKIIKVNITSTTTIVDLPEPSEEKILSSMKVLDGLRTIDELKAKRESVMNELESFTVEYAEKLERDIYVKHSKSEERENIKKSLSEASEWIYEQEMDTPLETYEKKLAALEKLTHDLESRVKIYSELPLAYEGMESILNYSRTFYSNMSNYTVGDNESPGSKPFTLVERKKLRNLNKDTIKWFKEQKALQKALKPTEKPVLNIELISLKIQEIDREVKYLLNKAKYFKPKVVNTNSTSTNSTKKTNTTQNANKTTESTTLPPPKKEDTTEKDKKSNKPVDEL